MIKLKTKFKKNAIKTISLIGAMFLLFGFGIGSYVESGNKLAMATAYVSKVNTEIKTNQEDFYDSNVVTKLPETVEANDEISVIVALNADSVMDAYEDANGTQTVSEYLTTTEAKNVVKSAWKSQNDQIYRLKTAGVSYELGERYNTVLNGFEITIKAKDFEKVNELLADKATLIVGESYEPAVTEVVENEVGVYETGIFDSSFLIDYQGDGVVVAVLDTGLDYTHTAFSDDNFTTSKEAFTLASVSKSVSARDQNGELIMSASKMTAGLTGEDVYVSRKVPFAYDYADKDPDVLPINSHHGTHVAGIIAGKDDVITGVAPNAQLAIMKVFSDRVDSAKDSWILSALEDCVALGVDVINMSLGSACGFSREVDKENKNVIYDRVREAGISLIAAAANSYNATMGSGKNGSNPLTSNPDSGTVGAPGTYESSLCVASVDGVKTPYLKYGDEIIYFNEATDSSMEKRNFVNELLDPIGEDVQSREFEYVTIPGVGRSADYPEEGDFYEGKIVLVKRGTISFEDKVRIALKEKGAAGIIIYNNVSGSISMQVGDIEGAACSIAQDEGEILAASESGILTISRSQLAGPFMSDFSSWGPTSDLKIKPEITAHGGEILSAVPGQGYDRLSGTSMAAPNQAGAAALIRQYVKYSGVFGSEESLAEKTTTVSDRVNQLMMSTADILLNKSGIPFSVRKQGSGLVNINAAVESAAYLTTYDKNGAEMSKTKLELGDDKDRTGVYTVTFGIHNISNNAISYDVSAVLLTEGVSSTYTGHGETTSTQEGYLLGGTTATVVSVSGDGTQSGNTVTVGVNKSATVTMRIVLSDADKAYINDSFLHGMYVEGFVTLDAVSGTNVKLNIPLLTFFGDWTEAPIFDEEYYDTNADELNAGLDAEDKLMEDAYATRVIGSLYSDYIMTLGAYAFIQNPDATPIAADKKYIALSNKADGEASSINGIKSIWAGFLRNVKEANISIVEDATGREIFSHTEYNLKKCFSSGSIYPSTIDMDFSTLEHNLKNNTKYTVTVATYIDYGAKEEQKNVRNVFEFPLYIDFEAPIVTDVTYWTEYDKTTKKTKLFADLSIYDNHYAMGVQTGYITADEDEKFTLDTFGKYITPVYSSFNSTSSITIELTDYIAKIKNSAGIAFDEDGELQIDRNNNSFVAICYDYALNSATYEIRLPDDIVSMYFTESELNLSPYETKDISSLLNVYPNDSWLEIVDFEVNEDGKDVVDIVNQTIIALKSGDAQITAIGYDKTAKRNVTAVLNVHVFDETEEGYDGRFTIPEVNKFSLTGYKTNKAYYNVSSGEREIGETGGTYSFGSSYALSMYPSESVTVQYTLDSYFPDRTGVTFKVGNSRIATVTETGEINAIAEGNTVVSVNVTFDGKTTVYSGRINVKVKDPFTTSGSYLMSYRGLGGEVVIPGDRGITSIYSYAFSGYKYVAKDLEAGDVIDEEDNSLLKQWYIGEDTITKIVIPEGVETIGSYAFANLTALEEVVLPSTLNNIGVGAFLGCKQLKYINLENVQFVNEKAFADCELLGSDRDIDLRSIVAIGNYSFQNCCLNYVQLPRTSQSLGEGAFYGNKALTEIQFVADKIKVGSYAFAECTLLSSVNINAAVIASYAFYGCSELTDVTLGKDVAVIGEFAFTGTKVSSFDIANTNAVLSTDPNDSGLILKDGELIIVAPNYGSNTLTTEATAIATGAFSGNVKIFKVVANNVHSVDAYAFAKCLNLVEISLPFVQTIGDYAFMDCTKLDKVDGLSNADSIGVRAFENTGLKSVTIKDGATVGESAFQDCNDMESVVLGENVKVGKNAFYCSSALSKTAQQTNGSLAYYTEYTYQPKEGVKYSYYRYDIKKAASALKSVTVGSNTVLGESAFSGNAKMETLTLAENVTIGDYAFYNVIGLTNVDLSKTKEIGEMAFYGAATLDFWFYDNKYDVAYEFSYEDGTEKAIAYKYSFHVPKLGNVDLSSIRKLGDFAFANNDTLNSVVLGADLKEIPDYAFAYCENLSSITLTDSVTVIGKYAFYGSSITNMELRNVSEIGEYAFGGTNLSGGEDGITFNEKGVVIGDGAFAECAALTKQQNLDKATYIGARAFYKTSLQQAELNAKFIGEFAFGESKLESVILGNTVKELGDNPFYGCPIESYGYDKEILFNGNAVGIERVLTYDVSDTVKVIDGVLYQVLPNGKTEIVSYPTLRSGDVYVIEEGTARISARAFYGTELKTVTIASTVAAIGDKAFYDCRKLTMVVFRSYEAPTLEEEYDETYPSFDTYAYTGQAAYRGTIYNGLGISKYYMWNPDMTSFYYGANFVNHIGQIENKLVMVKPANGQNFDTFIFSQYFATTVDGSNAADETTVAVIALIDALPEKITLSDEAAVVAARAAFSEITSYEQQALVTNLNKLTAAESTIKYLKLRNDESGEDPITPPDEENKTALPPYAGIVMIAVGLIGLGGLGYLFLGNRIGKKKKDNE